MAEQVYPEARAFFVLFHPCGAAKNKTKQTKTSLIKNYMHLI